MHIIKYDGTVFPQIKAWVFISLPAFEAQACNVIEANSGDLYELNTPGL